MSSVKARTSLFESGEAFNKKKPEAAPKKQNKKKEEEEEEEGSFQFADLVKVCFLSIKHILNGSNLFL